MNKSAVPETVQSRETPSVLPFSVGATAELTANVRAIEFVAGLYAVTIGTAQGEWRETSTLHLPATLISGTPLGKLTGLDVFVPSDRSGGWIGPEGGTIVINVPTVGGQILITTYRTTDQNYAPIEIRIARIDQPITISSQNSIPPAAVQPVATPTQVEAPLEIQAKITLHIERVGDCSFVSGDWVGTRGQQLRLEAFSVAPSETLEPGDILYKAFGTNGRQTPWVSHAKLCGTRRRGLALTGFAVKLAPHVSDRFDVTYQGAFFRGGISESVSNGERCGSVYPDDPLEAIKVRILKRTS